MSNKIKAVSDKKCLDALCEFLDGRDWNEDTIQVVIDTIKSTGRKLKTGVLCQ